VAAPQQTDTPIVPTHVRGCFVMDRRFSDEMPQWAREKFMDIAWEQAKQDEPGLREQLSGVSFTPLAFDAQVVTSQDAGFSEASAVAARVWMDDVVSTDRAPHYRMFLWVGHIDVPAADARFHLAVVVLVFGTSSD